MSELKYLEWDSFATIAVSGKSGSGKTSTMRFIIAQLLLNGVAVYVCDPHGNAGTGSLAESIQPVVHMLAAPIAITLQERIALFRHVNSILLRRIAGEDTSKQKIAIILDEAVAHFLESDKDQTNEFTTFLLRLANEGRKKDVSCFLLSQNWKSDFIGSRSVRSSISHILFHRTSEDEVKLFVDSMPAKIKRDIATLATGHMFVYPFLYKVKVPYISQDDMIDFANRNVQRIRTQQHENNSVQNDVQAVADDYSAKRANVQPVTDQEKSAINTNIARCTKMILQAKRDKKTKEQTILEVFNIRKSGSSERWRIASRFYDNVLKRYEEIST